LKDTWRQGGLLNRRSINKEDRYGLQIRGFINTKVDHSIKWEELENLEELGKNEVEQSLILQREGHALGNY